MKVGIKLEVFSACWWAGAICSASAVSLYRLGECARSFCYRHFGRDGAESRRFVCARADDAGEVAISGRDKRHAIYILARLWGFRLRLGAENPYRRQLSLLLMIVTLSMITTLLTIRSVDRILGRLASDGPMHGE
ncbi:MAG: hypothetical protein GPOALKHO_001149 [Sodalis sp.]|nr:MAG: hypothetical protein GPOALKHO_001149 [Sodalis sp.]